jgi:hypothetical protein
MTWNIDKYKRVCVYVCVRENATVINKRRREVSAFRCEIWSLWESPMKQVNG